MTVIPVNFGRAWNLRRRIGTVEIKPIPGGSREYQAFSVRWSGFPDKRIGLIAAVALYPNQARQQVDISVDGAAAGSGSVMFLVPPGGRLPEIEFHGYSLKDRPVFRSEHFLPDKNP